jgi:hypothetical protein
VTDDPCHGDILSVSDSEAKKIMLDRITQETNICDNKKHRPAALDELLELAELTQVI